MKQRPILYTTSMVQSIIKDIKSLTRRLKGLGIVNEEPNRWEFCRFYDGVAKFTEKYNAINEKYVKCPYGNVGDILWVRETWRGIPQDFGSDRFEYKASEKINLFNKWKPNIHMPKAACRLFLKITNIRVERLQDISLEDALAEGIERTYCKDEETGQDTLLCKNYLKDKWGLSPVHSFQTLWQMINGLESWNANPWVWVISFEKTENPNT